MEMSQKHDRLMGNTGDISPSTAQIVSKLQPHTLNFLWTPLQEDDHSSCLVFTDFLFHLYVTGHTSHVEFFLMK